MVVYKSTGSWYSVKDEDGSFYKARIKGKFKIEGLTSTNPIAVGDHVKVEHDPIEDTWMITGIKDRRNYINRISPHNRHQHHIVASNLDQSLLFATLKEPKTSLGFIDRFLCTSEAYSVPAIIVFNKKDLYFPKEEDQLLRIREIYEPMGYHIAAISVVSGEGIENLMKLLSNKVTLLSGHSGVGKSSFINKVFPELGLKTLTVSDWSGKGKHSTTFAEMFDLPDGGALIDTPGIREMGIVDVPKDELSHYFREMKDLIPQCKYNNCVHINEPGCAVKEGVNDGTVSEERYISYLTIRDSIEDKSY